MTCTQPVWCNIVRPAPIYRSAVPRATVTTVHRGSNTQHLQTDCPAACTAYLHERDGDIPRVAVRLDACREGQLHERQGGAEQCRAP